MGSGGGGTTARYYTPLRAILHAVGRPISDFVAFFFSFHFSSFSYRFCSPLGGPVGAYAAYLYVMRWFAAAACLKHDFREGVMKYVPASASVHRGDIITVSKSQWLSTD